MMESQTEHTGQLQALGLALAETLRKRGMGHIVLLSRLWELWPTIAGPMLAEVTRPEGIRGEVLFIAARDALWMQQVIFFQAKLLTNIRQHLGDVPFHRLHFTLEKTSFRQPVSSPPVEELEPVPLTAAEKQQIQDETACIADPELREAVRRAWQQGWQSRRSGV